MGDVLKIRDEYQQSQWAAAIQECKARRLTNMEYCFQRWKVFAACSGGDPISGEVALP